MRTDDAEAYASTAGTGEGGRNLRDLERVRRFGRRLLSERNRKRRG